MARYRHARYKVRSGEERVEEYLTAMQNKDRPAWTEEKIKIMAENFRDVATELSELDNKVRQIAPQLNIPTHKRLDLMRIVRRAWRLKNAGAAKSQYDEEISFMARKYGFDIATVNRVLEHCGLPTVGGAGGGGIRIVP